MNRPILICCLVIMFTITGCRSVVVCSPSRIYKNNWTKLQRGMTQEEVLKVIGEPALKSNINQPNQRWHYGAFELGENVLFPSDKAYVIWFDQNGKVGEFREPITEKTTK